MIPDTLTLVLKRKRDLEIENELRYHRPLDLILKLAGCQATHRQQIAEGYQPMAQKSMTANKRNATIAQQKLLA